jgi:hypothetical protein
MAQSDEEFATIPDRNQLDMFGAPPAQNYDPDPADVRAELNDLLAQARSAKVLPWPPARAAQLRTIFPQMANWLPEDEARQLRFAFEKELKRLKAA